MRISPGTWRWRRSRSTRGGRCRRRSSAVIRRSAHRTAGRRTRRGGSPTPCSTSGRRGRTGPSLTWRRCPRPGATCWRMPRPRPGSKPTAVWEKAGRRAPARGRRAGRADHDRVLARPGRPTAHPAGERPEPRLRPAQRHGLRGLAWTLAFLPPHPDTARALGALVETWLRKIAGLGPRNPKVANAGVIALSRIDGEEALAELARLAARVTYQGHAEGDQHGPDGARRGHGAQPRRGRGAGHSRVRPDRASAGRYASSATSPPS